MRDRHNKGSSLTGNHIAADCRRKTIASKTNAPTTSPILTNRLAAGRSKHKRVLGDAATSAG